jgi:hypothetical protein
MSEHEKSSGSLSDSDSSEGSSFGSSSEYFSSGGSSSSGSSSSCTCDFDGYVSTAYDGDITNVGVVAIENTGCGPITILDITCVVPLLSITPPLPHTLAEGSVAFFDIIGDGDIRAVPVDVVTDCTTKTLPSRNISP